MTWRPFSPEDVEAIAAAMDLRKPNAEALAVLAEKVAAGDGGEYVADLATGVGKTYLAAGLVDYLAQQGVRNVLIVVPSAAILAKTIKNFTPGSRKYVAGAQVEPIVITSENFARGSVGDALHDQRRLKLFIFTVQTLISPTLKATRKAHEENENIGDALYGHLQSADDLVIIVDEHHVIREKAKRFNAAVHDLGARAVVGLTATPDKSSEPNVVYRYPLAAAIADGLVKIPTIVYREDGRDETRTQLADACQLRRLKEPAWLTYAEAAGRQPVYPVIFIVCERIEEAHEVAAELRSEDMLPGAGEVLVITGDSKDADLAALAAIESPDSPVRAVVSVDKLKEGWDVSNIAVILATRKLASETLTEQILGRGLRLPFGERTGVPAIDQVDIVAHESYRRLLAQKDALLERVARQPEPAPTPAPQPQGEQQALDLTPLLTPEGTRVGGDSLAGGFAVTGGAPEILDGTSDADLLLAHEMGEAERQASQTTVAETMPWNDHPPIIFPAQRMVEGGVPTFSLASVSEAQVRDRGQAYAHEPDVVLRRVALNADRTLDGGVAVRQEYVDTVEGTRVVTSGAAIRDQLTSALMHAGLVEANFEQLMRAGELVTAFLAGAGIDDPDAEWEWSSAHAEKAKSALTGLISTVRAGQLAGRRTEFKLEAVKVPVPRPRPGAPRTIWDEFVKGSWVGPMKRSVDRYAQFDSQTAEFRLAQKIDVWGEVQRWNRVYTHTPTYVFWGGGRRYYVDFIVVTQDGTHWAIEAKSNKDATDSIEVQQKAEAAGRWIDQVNGSLQFGTWRYRLVTENHIAQAGDWEQLIALSA